ncbi:MAG TPA: oligosaccharide flippase family protein [Pyrinomonadaceae bacterium]|jgi:O-antigen/teichoic acid export membrane protein
MTTGTQDRSSLTAHATWMLLAKTLGYVFSFALPLLLVRRLNQEEFGLYKQVFLIVGSAVLILPFGFHMSAYYYLPREGERKGLIVFNILLFYLLVIGAACAAILLRPSLLSAILGGQELTAYAPLVALIVLTWGCSSFLETVAVANQEIRLATIFIVTSNLTKTAFMIGAVVVFGSFRALLYASILQGALQLITLLIYLRRRFGRFWRGFDRSLLRAQLSYALPLGVAATILRFQIDLDNFFVSKQLGAAALAVYSIGCFNIPLFFLISDAIGSVMIPRVSSLQKAGARREIVELLARMIRKLSAIALPFYALLLVVGPQFIVVLFTTKYIASWPIFAINLAQIPLSVITSAYDPVLRAYAEQRYFLLRARVVLVALLAVALWFGTRRFGMIGAVSIVVAASVVERVIISLRVGRLLGVTRRDWALLKDVGKLLVASAFAACVTLLARKLAADLNAFILLGLCGVVFSICYLLALLILGVLTPQEQTIIKRWVALARRYLSGTKEQDSLA